MRVQRFALIYGVFNLIVGLLAMFSPFVKHDPARGLLNRFMPGKGRGVINRQPGRLFGFMGAVNPPHAILAIAAGLLGVLSGLFGRFSRGYLALLGGLSIALAAVGWASTGFKPGIKNVLGLSVDISDNIQNTLMGAGALFLAARPALMRSPMMEEEVLEVIEFEPVQNL